MDERTRAILYHSYLLHLRPYSFPETSVLDREIKWKRGTTTEECTSFTDPTEYEGRLSPVWSPSFTTEGVSRSFHYPDMVWTDYRLQDGLWWAHGWLLVVPVHRVVMFVVCPPDFLRSRLSTGTVVTLPFTGPSLSLVVSSWNPRFSLSSSLHLWFTVSVLRLRTPGPSYVRRSLTHPHTGTCVSVSGGLIPLPLLLTHHKVSKFNFLRHKII